MNLIIDQGNTQAKLAIFENGQMIAQNKTAALTTCFIEEFIDGHQIDATILSSVIEIPESVLFGIKKLAPLFFTLSHTLKLPFTITYHTPETLGRDRIAAVAGAWAMHPNQNILVIDAGTAITYDFIDSSGNYPGGNIAPGLEMRFKALHKFTGKLPLISKTGDTPLLGYNTETAIRAGVAQGMIFEIESYIHRFRERNQNLLIFLTGGDAFYFGERLKSSIFADEYLVLKGLNSLLEYNAKN